MSIIASGLNVFPIKGGRPIAVRRMAFDALGPIWDRRFMVVDPDGNKVTQREVPRLALLRTQPLDPIMMQLRFIDDRPGDYEDVYFALEQEPIQADVWGDVVPGVPMADPVNDWLSEKLGRAVRLVRTTSDFPRLSRGARKRGGDDVRVGYADGYPLLIISEASLEDLNRRLVEADLDPVPMSRFRPNIVLSGCEPYEEDRWLGKTIQIGTMRIHMANLCKRCQVVNIDQDTGQRTKQPLKTLGAYRVIDRGIRFGVRADHLTPEGFIDLGAGVRVLD